MAVDPKDVSQLQVHTLRGEAAGPQLLITAGVHGDEYEPIVAVQWLRANMEGKLLRGTLTLIPIANLSAVQSASRVGEDGLDLARTFPGDCEGSITQQVAAQLTKHIAAAEFLIDLHTGGRVYEIEPLVGYMLHRDAQVLKRQREMANAFGLPIIWGTSDSLQGRSLSAARDASTPAIYAEYGGGGICRSEGIEAYVQGCLGVMEYLGMMHKTARTTLAPLIVEDASEGSGHLQVQHPAGIAGVFERKVLLGQCIEKGQVLGRIIDPVDGEQGVEVVADESGIVIVLRSTAMVAAGDSLAVVLPTDQPYDLRAKEAACQSVASH